MLEKQGIEKPDNSIIEAMELELDPNDKGLQDLYQSITNKLAFRYYKGNKVLTSEYIEWTKREQKKKEIKKKFEELKIETKNENEERIFKLCGEVPLPLQKIFNLCVTSEQKKSFVNKIIKILYKTHGTNLNYLRKQKILHYSIVKVARTIIPVFNSEKLTKEQIWKTALKIDVLKPIWKECFFNFFNEYFLIKGDIRLELLPSIKKTVKYIIEKYPLFIMNTTKDLYLYENGVYNKQKDSKEVILTQLIFNVLPINIKEIVGDALLKRRVLVIVDEIIAKKTIDESEIERNILNFKNGLLKLEDIKNQKWKLYQHSPEYRTIIQFKVNFNPFSKRSKKIKEFFLKQLGPDQTTRLLKHYGNALMGKPYKFKIFTFLLGPSGTGKSEFILKVIQRIVGNEHISRVELTSLAMNSESNFASGHLIGAYLNICGDLTSHAFEHPEVINLYTEKIITVNKKYGFKGDILNRCSHFYAMNELPEIVNDERKDVFRRIDLIKIIGKPIQEDERDPDFLKNLIKDNPFELEGFLNEILMELSENLRTNNLELPKIIKRREDYRVQSLPLLNFIRTYIERDYNAMKKTKPSDTYLISRQFFLDVYNQFRVKNNQEKKESLHALTKEEERLPKNERLYRKTRNRISCFSGIYFRPLAFEELNIDKEKEMRLENLFYPKSKSKTKPEPDEKANKIVSQIMKIIEGNK